MERWLAMKHTNTKEIRIDPEHTLQAEDGCTNQEVRVGGEGNEK